MKNYKNWIIGALCALALVTSTFAATEVASVTQPCPTENWVLSLGGVGATTTDEVDSAFGLDFSVGRTGKWLVANEYGIRQSVSYGNDNWTLNTRAYNDWTLATIKSWKLDVFGGGAIGLQYGNQKPSWEIAPEAGLRWWIKDDVAILGRVEVPWDMGQWEFKDTVRYFIGFQVKF